MKRLFLLICSVTIAMSFAHRVDAQTDMQPTPPPLVTAQNESWYVNREPVVYAGNLYYAAGPQIHFNGNEMVRSGVHNSIPLYTKSTAEPNSVVYVPLAGGLMQPYERRREGDLAGTTGSSAPSFPVVLPSEQRVESSNAATALPQAPGSPALTAPAISVEAPAAATVGTSGRITSTPRKGATTAVRPKGLNGVFVEFNNQRWFSSGPSTAFDSSRFTRIGEYRGFDVYVRKDASLSTIYIPVVKGDTDFVAPYSKRR